MTKYFASLFFAIIAFSLVGQSSKEEISNLYEIKGALKKQITFLKIQ